MLLDEVCKFIDDNSTGRETGINLFKSFRHENTPDTATFVQEYGGREPALRMGSSTPFYELPRIQILERSTDYQTARNNAEVWYRLFMGTNNTILKPSTGATGTRYLALKPLQSPFSIGIDELERHQIVFNVEAMKSLST